MFIYSGEIAKVAWFLRIQGKSERGKAVAGQRKRGGRKSILPIFSASIFLHFSLVFVKITQPLWSPCSFLTKQKKPTSKEENFLKCIVLFLRFGRTFIFLFLHTWESSRIDSFAVMVHAFNYGSAAPTAGSLLLSWAALLVRLLLLLLIAMVGGLLMLRRLLATKTGFHWRRPLMLLVSLSSCYRWQLSWCLFEWSRWGGSGGCWISGREEPVMLLLPADVIRGSCCSCRGCWACGTALPLRLLMSRSCRSWWLRRRCRISALLAITLRRSLPFSWTTFGLQKIESRKNGCVGIMKWDFEYRCAMGVRGTSPPPASWLLVHWPPPLDKGRKFGYKNEEFIDPPLKIFKVSMYFVNLIMYVCSNRNRNFYDPPPYEKFSAHPAGSSSGNFSIDSEHSTQPRIAGNGYAWRDQTYTRRHCKHKWARRGARGRRPLKLWKSDPPLFKMAWSYLARLLGRW